MGAGPPAGESPGRRPAYSLIVCRIRNAKPGRQKVLVQAHRMAAAWAQVVAGPGRPVQNQLVLEPGGSLEGKVVGPDDRLVAGAWISCAILTPYNDTDDDALELDLSARSGADGTFRLAPLPAVPVRISVETSPRGLFGEVTLEGPAKDVVIAVRPPEPRPPARAR
jgi:hypothetical protein